MWHGMPNDDKLRVVTRRIKQPMAITVALWAYVLDYASQSEDRGSIEGVDYEAAAICLDLEEETVAAFFGACADKGMVVDGRVTNWEKRQPKREDSSSERVRKHRKKQEGNATKRNVTQCNAPDTDTDTDTEKKKEPEELIPFQKIINHLNDKTGKAFRPTTPKTRQIIQARWREGFRLADFESVIDTKTDQWRGDPKMVEYLRPETLFGTKFEAYLNQGDGDQTANLSPYRQMPNLLD